MLISVIIPTCHRNDLLVKCLDRLAPGGQLSVDLDRADAAQIPNRRAVGANGREAIRPRYEVIVSDDGSQTTAERIMRESYPWLRWVAGPGKGPAANRNKGAQCARGAWLAFLDDDCLPDANWLAAYAERMESQMECQVFEGRTYPDREKRSLAEVSPVNESGGYLWSCNFAIAKAVFEDIGGFNERYPYAAMEDVDLRDRLRKCRVPVQFVPEASVCHPWRPAGGLAKLRQYEYSLRVYLELHPEKRSELSALFYLRLALRGLLKEALPGIWRFRGAGLLHSVGCQLFYLGLAGRLVARQLAHGAAVPAPTR